MMMRRRQSGFSLTEVLLAIVTLAIGMLFVGGTFVLGVHFSRLSTEQSIGIIAAEEAFAKLRLYDIDSLDTANSVQGNLVLLDVNGLELDPNAVEYTYPSTEDVLTRQYRWAAIGRQIAGGDLIQVTVFVLREQFSSDRIPELIEDVDTLKNQATDGMKIVHDQTGLIQRVSIPRDDPSQFTLTPPLPNGFDLDNSKWWMIDPIEGRDPCVGIYQETIRIVFPADSGSGIRR